MDSDQEGLGQDPYAHHPDPSLGRYPRPDPECQPLRAMVTELITVSEQLCDGRVLAQPRAATHDAAKGTWRTAFVAAESRNLTGS